MKCQYMLKSTKISSISRKTFQCAKPILESYNNNSNIFTEYKRFLKYLAFENWLWCSADKFCLNGITFANDFSRDLYMETMQ